MAPLWTAEQASEATGGQLSGGNWQAGGISIDSRTVQPGDIFIALQGERFDGHDYVATALEQGAVAAMVSAPVAGMPDDAPLLWVKDTQSALEALATHRRQAIHARIIAVTGSVGKTSVKTMLAHVLAGQGRTHATQGNLNNHIGLPLSLARMPLDTEYGVFELGMNHAGELSALTAMLRPHVAVITAIEAVHLEYFSGIGGIVAAKSEIFEGVEDGGYAVVPFDSHHLPVMAGNAHKQGIAIEHIYSFGVGEEARYRLVKGKAGFGSQSLRVDANGKKVDYTLPLSGSHQAINSLAVLAGVDALGADVVAAAQALAGVPVPPGRGSVHLLRINGCEITLIDDSYNASPASMRAACEVLGQAEGRKLAVLGDMLELGDDAEAFHRQLADILTACKVDKVFTCGPLMAALADALPEDMAGAWCRSAGDMLPVIQAEVQEGDVVLVKGSHGSNLWQLAQQLRDSHEERK